MFYTFLKIIEFYLDFLISYQCYAQFYFYMFIFSLLPADLTLVNSSEDCVYLCGNSLGLCPKKTKVYMDIEIDKWSKL